MASLGRLTLHLSATLGQLRADLAQAKTMATTSHGEMQSILGQPINWGITKGLRTDLTQAERVFSSSLGRMQTLGRQGISIGVNIDQRSVNDAIVNLNTSFSDINLRVGVDKRSVNDAIVEIGGAISNINRESIIVSVDDSALTRLNQHYALKWKHHEETIQRLGKPIILRVDDSALKASHHVQATQQVKVEVDSRDIDRIGKSIEVSLRLGASRGIGGVIKGIGNIAIAPIKVGFDIAAFPIREVSRGMLQGLGRDLSRGLSTSFAGAINSSLSDSIGSLDLVGRKAAEATTRQVGRAKAQYYGANPEAKAIATEMSGQVRGFLGEKDVAIEANRVRGERVKIEQRNLELARTGAIAERRAIEAELQLAQQRYSTAAKEIQIQLQNAKTPQERRDLTIAGNELLNPREADLLIARQRQATSDRQLGQLRRVAPPKLYQEIVDNIAPGLAEHRVPALVSRSLGGNTQGRYNALLNRIEVDPKIYAQIQKGRLDRRI
jgi:hypothetical protein